MPAYRGLFAAAIPLLLAAPFSSSPYLQPGPTTTFEEPLAPEGPQVMVIGAPEPIAVPLSQGVPA
jgi:hypothetical protein